ncbi:MAG: NUDIX hydrolase [Isosphaeraceae bacterium]|nr:NUDIX hydrolase [Isosphaeraceae bacterium]
MTEPSWLALPGESESIEANWLFNLCRQRFRSRISDKEHDFYVLHLADSVNVIALTTERELVCVRQFRAGSGEDSLEIPGGLLEAGEDPLTAGARELLEETGYSGSAPRLISSVWSNPSLLTSRSHTILIENVSRVAQPSLDPSEELTIELIPESRILESLRDGTIGHALVVAALSTWLLQR